MRATPILTYCPFPEILEWLIRNLSGTMACPVGPHCPPICPVWVLYQRQPSFLSYTITKGRLPNWFAPAEITIRLSSSEIVKSPLETLGLGTSGGSVPQVVVSNSKLVWPTEKR